MNGPTCEYCGRCLSVCPSYKHHLVETFGPRARIALARAAASGELKPGERYHESIKSCMQCLACTEICGKGVDGAQIILDARLAEGDGKLTLKRRLEKMVTCALLPRRELTRKVVRACSLFQWMFPLDRRGSIRHLPDALCGAAGKRSMPALAGKSLFDILPERIMPPDDVTQTGEVALFTGCFGGLVNVEASLRLVGALTARGYTVFLPRAQSCCGAPAQLSGFGKAFEKAQAHNAEVFAACGTMPVLTLCATCHRTLSREYTLAERNSPAASRTPPCSCSATTRASASTPPCRRSPPQPSCDRRNVPSAPEIPSWSPCTTPATSDSTTRSNTPSVRNSRPGPG